MDDLAIDIQYASKLYKGGLEALKGISLKVHRGSVVGLLGPNGAGKSTLVKILMTVIRPTKIKGTLLGKNIGDRSILKKIGYLPEHHQFPKYLTALQMLELYGTMTGVTRKERKIKAPQLLEFVGLSSRSKDKLGTYSKGMLQRAGLAQALINDPELLVLDEPTDGVDPIGRKDIREMILSLKDKGKSCLINSHLLSEVEATCDEAVILNVGEVLVSGKMNTLLGEDSWIELTLKGIHSNWTNTEGIKTTTNNLEKTTIIKIKGTNSESIQPIIDEARKKNITIKSIVHKHENLEDLLVRKVQTEDKK